MDVGCFSSTAFLFMYSCILFMTTTGSSKNKSHLAVWLSEYDLITQKTSSISSHIILQYLILCESSIGEQRLIFFQNSAITEKLGVCFRLIQFRQDNDLR